MIFEDPPQPAPRRRGGRALAIVGGVLAVAVAGVGLTALINRQYIEDQFSVWSYDSSATIDGYVASTTMSDRGTFLFLASQPEVTDDASFNDTCGTHEEGAGILGCYLPNTGRILLFDVSDERLAGLSDVVAAHEMLHAAWDRMSDADRDALAPLLDAAADELADDDEFTERMEFYERSEPGERLNELHSIIGTEVDDLDPALEAHYAEYFTDRAALVAMHRSSNAVFEDLEAQSAKLVKQLDRLRERIDKDYETYTSGYDVLEVDIERFNVRADNGTFASQAQFDAERANIVDRQEALDDLYDEIEERSDRYDKKRAQLDELSTEASELNESINITPRDGDAID